MGWDWNPTGTRETEIPRLLKPWTSDGIERKPIAHSLRGTVLWSVWETSDGKRWIGCDLISTKGGGCGYKRMEESMGPCQLNCPLNYLEMVPDPGGYATEWRAKVRAWHAHQKKTFIVGRRYALKFCTIPWIRLTSNKPLRGTYQGQLYRIKRPQLGALLTEDAVEDPVEGSEKANEPYIVEAAWGDWHGSVPKGMVGVFACRGGRCDSGNYSPFQAYFLVTQEEYDRRGPDRFVIDEARHQRVDDFTQRASITKCVLGPPA